MENEDTVSWDSFKDELIRHVGIKRAQVIFSEETNTPQTLLSYWKGRDVVPREAYDLIAGIEIGKVDSDRFKGFHTKRFFERVIELSNQNIPLASMSAILTKEFSRKVTEGAVKSARYRMKERIEGYRTRGA